MIRIRRATPGDLDAMRDLLVVSGLPTEGFPEGLGRFLVAEEEGRLVATAGIELGEGCALLRSVAVAPGARGAGVGVEIVRQALRLASVSGAQSVYLLTTTAAGFFPRFGFVPALRAEVEAKFPDSTETRPGGVCASADALVLRDLSRILQPHRRD
jgi:amino-acid N-acetyltransferase